jgi:type I restriction-modification system DNA methylase subunit
MTSSAHQTKLIKEILAADSQTDVKQLIEASIELLRKNKTKSQTVFQWVNQLIQALELLSPLEKNARQWSNVKIAKIQCFRIKKTIGPLLPDTFKST